jgi:photosystem II stability/assembly factor-like uncharacterized protein
MHKINVSAKQVMFLALLAALLCAPVYAAERWINLGPDGGDVRSLAYDPHDPSTVFMGSMAGKFFISSDGGASWTRAAHLGSGNDYVLEKIVVDPSDHKTMYVAAWSLDNHSGDLFRSRDGGKSWKALEDLRGKAVRAVALAPSNPKIVVAGTLDGVFRSHDGGDSFSRISPLHHAEIRNLDSVAIDPKDADVIYVGTWHLPWKTTDGGRNWASIKKGMIDDSDVFSIIIDPRDPAVLYASACSGIYKSADRAGVFHKVQGMPFSARRTRVLAMDPNNSKVVYAGTTEGLWKTQDGGTSFRLMTAPNVVVNDIFIDPREPRRVMLATDRGGVLLSNDAGNTFTASNRGFSHRQVTAMLVDRNNSQKMYAGIINGREFGGVFATSDAGANWKQMSAGLGGRDVLSLRQADNGSLIAGTNKGIFLFAKGASSWKPAAGMVSGARVSDISLSAAGFYAATARGLFKSANQGSSWYPVPAVGRKDFVVVGSRQRVVAGASRNLVAVSTDRGAHWFMGKLPNFVTGVRDLTVAADSSIWVATREGAFRSTDAGHHWVHVTDGLPSGDLNSIVYEETGKRMLATSSVSDHVYQSTDQGRRWETISQVGWPVHSVITSGDRMFVTTMFDGILEQSSRRASSKNESAGGGQ